MDEISGKEKGAVGINGAALYFLRSLSRLMQRAGVGARVEVGWMDGQESIVCDRKGVGLGTAVGSWQVDPWVWTCWRAFQPEETWDDGLESWSILAMR